MKFVLKNLPYGRSVRPETVAFAGRSLRIKEHQILIWVSVGLPSAEKPLPNSQIPAILDTGLSHNFSIYEGHLKYLGVPSHFFPKLGDAKLAERPNDPERKTIRVPKIDANLWVWRNIPGSREINTSVQPYLFPLKGGIVVHTAQSPNAPRQPTFGLKAISDAKITLTIDGEKQQVSMYKYGWLSRLFRGIG